MLQEKFKHHNIILASGSPRRQELLRALNIPFEIRLKDIPENYPSHLEREEITVYLSNQKADAFMDELKENDILITADTIVWLERKAIEKPRNKKEAVTMLKKLAGATHEVVTSFSISTLRSRKTVSAFTLVHFVNLTDVEIEYYVDNYKPYDKAGGYGIQEWLGFIGVSGIEGSYFNVMGLPVHKIFEELKNLSF